MLALLVLLVNFASAGVAVSTLLETQSSCGEDCTPKCGATPKPAVLYMAVSKNLSYKALNILFKSLRNNSTVQIYHSFERLDLLENSLDPLLPNVTALDSGEYLCILAARVGKNNMVRHAFLKVYGCPKEYAQNDILFEVIVCVSLALALLMCFICWVCLKNISILKSKRSGSAEQTLKVPHQKKNLNLIYTHNLSSQGSSSHHHVFV